MHNKFDELTRRLAQSVTRRQALKKFSVGLLGTALACFGLAATANARHCRPYGAKCSHASQCCSGLCWADPYRPFGYFR